MKPNKGATYYEYVFRFVLVGAEEAEDDEYEVEEVCDDGEPHEPEEVEHLTQCRARLHQGTKRSRVNSQVVSDVQK